MVKGGGRIVESNSFETILRGLIFNFLRGYENIRGMKDKEKRQ